MAKKLTIALHGFLGLPSDWDHWIDLHSDGGRIEALHLWDHPRLNPSLNLSDWTQAFLKEVKLYKKMGYTVDLWGYSMGGRLALGALLAEPELFNRATILSANPGLESDHERTRRHKQDLIWQQKFKVLPWKELIEEWNHQSIFQEPFSVDKSVYQRDNEVHRSQLATAIVDWSIAKQTNYWPLIPYLKIPIEWHAGELDTSYAEITRRVCSMNPSIHPIIHARRGHRVLSRFIHST